MERAIETAANILGEGFLFTVAALLVLYEQQRYELGFFPFYFTSSRTRNNNKQRQEFINDNLKELSDKLARLESQQQEFFVKMKDLAEKQREDIKIIEKGFSSLLLPPFYVKLSTMK